MARGWRGIGERREGMGGDWEGAYDSDEVAGPKQGRRRKSRAAIRPGDLLPGRAITSQEHPAP